MNHKSGRFIDHQNGFIFIDDIKRYLLCNPLIWCLYLRQSDGYILSGRHRITFPGNYPIDNNPSLLQPLLQCRAGIAFKETRQNLVETFSLLFFRDSGRQYFFIYSLFWSLFFRGSS
jgi:hypothetical protein